MASVFTKIINGEIPGRFVYEDEHCVAFLTNAPVQPGHTLVVPREEIDDWLDVPGEVSGHMFTAAQHVGRALRSAFDCERVAVVILGMQVPHCHLHLIPINDESDMDFAHADPDAPGDALDEAAERIRGALG